MKASSIILEDGGQAENGKLSVSSYANQLEAALPNIVCVGSDWYVEDQGVFRPQDKSQFRRKAQEILLPNSPLKNAKFGQ